MPNGETVYEAPTISHRTEIWKIILDRGFGRPLQAVQVDQQSASKIIHEVRWLPPDPNDHSKVIEPEP